MSNHAMLHRVCKEVLASAAPPTRIRDGFSICALTGIHIEVLDPPTRIHDVFSICALTGFGSKLTGNWQGCIDLSKNNRMGVSTSLDVASTTPPSSSFKAHPATAHASTTPTGVAENGGSSLPGGAQQRDTTDMNQARLHPDHYRRFKDLISTIISPTTPSSPSGTQLFHGKTSSSSFPSRQSKESEPAVTKNSLELTVHPRFGFFLLSLWLVGKIDHVLRNFTRCWTEKHAQGENVTETPEDNAGNHGTSTTPGVHAQSTATPGVHAQSTAKPGKRKEPDSTQDLCEEFAEQTETFHALCNMFNHCFNHVYTSLDI